MKHLSGGDENGSKRRKSKNVTPPKKDKREKDIPSEVEIDVEMDEDDDDDDDDEYDDVASSDGEAGPSSVQKYVEQLSQGLGLVASSPTTPKSSKKRKSQKKDSDSSGEEERWLDAIQSGKLEEVDEELKKVKSKDPKLMTARQRAMLERKGDRDVPEQQLMSLPSGYKEVVLTAEAMQRKALKSQKQKEKADEKREKDKIKTMERLLKKQESKTMKTGAKKGNKRNWPVISYINNEEGSRISLPAGVKFPLDPVKNVNVPLTILCKAPNCRNPKRYSCGKTGIPLCSLECYQKNIDTLISQAFS